MELSRYEEDLLAVQGTCLLCRAGGEVWNHPFSTCPRQYDFFAAKDRVREQCGGRWTAPFAACYWCYNPQLMCPRADPNSTVESCLYGDIVMPLCYRVFQGVGSNKWLQDRFGRSFASVEDFLI